MSIYNRRMFNRNARNALNASAGIQSFAPGGPVQLSGSTFYPGRNTVGRATSFPISRGQTTAPRISLTRPEAEAVSEARNAPPLPFSSIDRGLSGMVGDLFGGKTSPKLGIAALQQGAKGLANVADIGIDLIGLATSPFRSESVQDPPAGATTSMAKRDPATGDFIRNPDGSIKVFEGPENTPGLPTPNCAPMVISPGTTADDLQGVDITTLPLGIAGNIPQKNQAFPNVGVQAGQAFRIADPSDRTQKQFLEETLGAEDADLPKSLIDPPLEKAILEERAKTDTDSTEGTEGTEGTEDTKGEVVSQVGPASRPKDVPQKKVIPATSAAEQQTAADQVAETFDKVATDSVSELTIEDYKKEFLEQMPKYEGTDPGLFLAQVGFSMAEGKDPRAIVNASKALKEVLPSIIKDRKEIKSFERQIDLSATQYALGEVGKQRAAVRELQKADRNLKYFVATEDIPEKGVTKGNIVSFTEGDIRNGVLSKFPVTDITIYNNDRDNEAIITKAKSDLAKEGRVAQKDVDAMMEKYREAANKYTQFGGLRLIVESNITKVATKGDEFLGGMGILKDAALKAVNTVYKGDALPDDFKDRKTYRDDMRNVANQMVREILGESAKNISNIDRNLADEVSGLVQDLTVAETPETILPKLQRLLTRIDSIETDADQALNDFETTWRNTIVKGSGINVYDLQRRARERLTGTSFEEDKVFAQGTGGNRITFSQITDDSGNFSVDKYNQALKQLGIS